MRQRRAGLRRPTTSRRSRPARTERTDPVKLGKIKARIIGVFGNQDRGIPPETVNAFDKALTTAGVKHEIHRYDANHAFANPSSDRYNERAAGNAWEKVQAFLSAEL